MKGTRPDWNSIFVSATRSYWDPLLRFGLSLSNSREQADDLLQTALLKALKAFPRFMENHFENIDPSEAVQILALPQNSAHLRNWLYKILRNTWLDEKTVSKRWSFSEDTDEIEGLNAGPDGTTQGHDGSESLKEQEKEFYRLALDDNWKKKLGNLSERQRSLLFLVAEDYSYKEIAALLEIPIGTVMSTLSRTLQKLKKK